MDHTCDVCGEIGTGVSLVLVTFHDERYGSTHKTWQHLCATHQAGLTLLAEQMPLIGLERP